MFVNRHALLIVAFLIGAASLPSSGWALNPNYVKNGKQMATCSAGKESYKVAGTIDGEALRISGIVECEARGDSYVYNVRFLNIHRTAAVPKSLAVPLAWASLAVYRVDGDSIDWIEEPTRALSAVLAPGRTKIVIGNFKFSVPKASVARANRMMIGIFYGHFAQSVWF